VLTRRAPLRRRRGIGRLRPVGGAWRDTFAKTKYMFDVIAEVPAGESDSNCDSPWAQAAKKSIAASTALKRPGYTPKTV